MDLHHPLVLFLSVVVPVALLSPLFIRIPLPVTMVLGVLYFTSCAAFASWYCYQLTTDKEIIRLLERGLEPWEIQATRWIMGLSPFVLVACALCLFHSLVRGWRVGPYHAPTFDDIIARAATWEDDAVLAVAIDDDGIIEGEFTVTGTNLTKRSSRSLRKR